MAQIDQIEVTQGDFTTAVNVLSMVRDGGLNIGPVSAVIARYRIASEKAAVLRGVKAALEVVATQLRSRANMFEITQKAGGCDAVLWDELLRQETTILALDPQAIAKETPDAD